MFIYMKSLKGVLPDNADPCVIGKGKFKFMRLGKKVGVDKSGRFGPSYTSKYAGNDGLREMFPVYG